MQTYSLLQVLVKPGQPQASDIERLTPFFEGQISNKKMYNVCSLYLEWLKIFDVIKKIMVCARLNENIKQTLWMQTDAEEGTLQEKKNLMHCGCPISTLYESSHTLYQISSLPNPTNYLINHPPPPTTWNSQHCPFWSQRSSGSLSSLIAINFKSSLLLIIIRC